MKIEDFMEATSVEKSAQRQGTFKPVTVIPLPGEGWYGGRINGFKQYGDSLKVEVEVFNLKDHSINYGTMNGFIRKYTNGNDITAWFYDTFGNPSNPWETIGKTCAVYVRSEFSPSRNQDYNNVVKFAEMPEENKEAGKAKKEK